MSQNLERFGVEAIWLDAKFEKGVKGYNDSIKKADKETENFTRDSAKSFQQFDQQASASFTDATAKVLVWGAVAQQVFAQFEAGAREAAARGVFVRLSGGAANATANINALREATGSAAGNQQLMEQATTLLNLKIAKSSDELGRAARSITVTASAAKGFTADQAIQSFTLLASNFESSKARLDDFGLTLDDVQPKIDEYTAAGAEASEAIRLALLDALDEKFIALGGDVETAAKGVDRFKAAGDNLLGTFRAAISSGEGFGKILEFLTRGLNAGAQAVTLLSGGVGALVSLISSIDDLITGTLTLEQVLDQAADAGVTAFLDSAQALGVFTDDMGAATQATDEAASGMDRFASATTETADALQKFNDAIASGRTQSLEAFLARSISVERKLEDAAIARARKIEDFERQSAAKRAQIEEQFAQTVANLQDQATEQRRSNAIALARQLEQIERNYQERKRAINRQFATSFARAVRSRDALALFDAIRTRKTDLDEAKLQRDQERSEATTNAAQQEEEQQRSLDRQIEAARAARAQQLIDAQTAEAAQLEAMRLAEERKTEDRALAGERWLEDQARAFENRRQRALSAYRQDEQIYLQHLQRMLQLTNTFIPAIYRSGGGGGAQQGAGRRPRQKMAEGGAFVTAGATDITVGEAGREFVMVQPLSQISNVNPVGPQVAGQMRHQIGGEIEASMAGFEGRLTAEVQRAVLTAFREVLR